MNRREVYTWTHGDTGAVTDSKALTTSKPTTASVTKTATLVDATVAAGNAPIKAEKAVIRAIVSFANADTSDHTAKYTIEVNGTQVVDNSSGSTATASTTTSFTEDIEVDMPSTGSVQIDVYAWTDDATNVTLATHRFYYGVGTKSTTGAEVFAVLDPYRKNISVDVTESGGTTTKVVNDSDGNQIISTTDDVSIAAGDAVLKLTAAASNVAWVDRVMLSWL